MENTILRAAGALSLAAVALVAPTTAHAYTDPAAVVATPSTITAGGISTFTPDLAPFATSESIQISITGESAGGAKLAFVKAAVETDASLTTRAVQGKLNVPITFPTNGLGTYDLTFAGATSGVALHSQITVVAPTAPPGRRQVSLSLASTPTARSAGGWPAVPSSSRGQGSGSGRPSVAAAPTPDFHPTTIQTVPAGWGAAAASAVMRIGRWSLSPCGRVRM